MARSTGSGSFPAAKLRQVAIRFYLVTGWRNEPAGLEGQQLKWVAIADLADEDLLPADKPVIAALQELQPTAAR